MSTQSPWGLPSGRLNQSYLLKRECEPQARAGGLSGPKKSVARVYLCIPSSWPRTLVFPKIGTFPVSTPCVSRKQEELVQQVRKRLEEALMADMLAHVEELARDGEAPLDKPGAEEEVEDEEDEEEEPDQDQEMEHM